MPQAHPELPDVGQLFEEVPCGLLVTAVDGTILRVNRTFCDWLGVAPEQLVGRRRLQELLTVGARIFHQTHWLPMLQMQGSIAEVKFDLKAREGRTLPVLFNVVRKATPSGTCDLISAIVAEDRNKYERELLAARKRADNLTALEKDRSLLAEQMIGIVSHDLRNPLSVVMMASTTLAAHEDRLDAGKRRQLIASITRAAVRAQKLIEDLLDFTLARVGSGLTVVRGPLDLHRVASKAVDELRVAYPGRELVSRAVGPGQVMADADRLTQLLGNLIGNALTYGDPGAAVTVTSSVSEGQARLSVHNEGAAIEPDVLATMFQPMVRGGGGENTARSVGLGLFIVSAVAAAHGGSVSVTSTKAAGTEFVVVFPAHA